MASTKISHECAIVSALSSFFFFCNDTATTEIYTLSLHDALPISPRAPNQHLNDGRVRPGGLGLERRDRKSTRLNSSHVSTSYAVFCLQKKTKIEPVRFAGTLVVVTCELGTRVLSL